MQYSASARWINWLFIIFIFVAPIGYCLYDASVPAEVGRSVIALSFLLAAFAIVDWYHFYSSNSYKGILGVFGLGAGVAVTALTIASLISGSSLVQLASFESLGSWATLEWFLRVYIGGIGTAAAAIVSIPRLFLIRTIEEGDLPHANDA